MPTAGTIICLIDEAGRNDMEPLARIALLLEHQQIRLRVQEISTHLKDSLVVSRLSLDVKKSFVYIAENLILLAQRYVEIENILWGVTTQQQEVDEMNEILENIKREIAEEEGTAQ